MHRHRLPVLLAVATLVLFAGIAGAAPEQITPASAPTFELCQPNVSASGTAADLILPAAPPSWLPQAPPGYGCPAAFCAACAANGEMCINVRICICI